jgi:hypothetical protein
MTIDNAIVMACRQQQAQAKEQISQLVVFETALASPEVDYEAACQELLAFTRGILAAHLTLLSTKLDLAEKWQQHQQTVRQAGKLLLDA